MDGVTTDTLTVDEAGEAVRLAQAELERAVREGNLAKDPMRLPLGALAVTLGAQHRLYLATVEQMRSAADNIGQQLAAALKEAREPIDPAALARLEKAAATGAERRAAQLASTHSWRTILVAVGVYVASLAVVASVAVAWGRAAERVAVQGTEQRLAAAFAAGPVSARTWALLMENNDAAGALSHCTGSRLYTDADGRRVCSVALYIEPPKQTAPDAPR